MPTYDYVCGACGHRLEVVHGIHGHGPEVCPVCAGPMRKAFVVPTVHFKGSGWAKKDRGAAASTKAAAKAGAGGDAASGDQAGTSTDGTAGSESGPKPPAGTKPERDRPVTDPGSAAKASTSAGDD